MAERWRRIPAYRLLGIPSGYEASSEKRVRSVPRTLRNGRRIGGTVLAVQWDPDGYAMIKLGRKLVRRAIVVQLAFAGPPEVRHLDDERSNDRPENLAWGSRVENEQDKRKGKERKKREGWDSPFPDGTPGTGELC